MVRNTEELITVLSQAIETGQDSSLAPLQIEPTQALADLRRMGELIHSRQPDGQASLQALYERYAQAASPKKGKPASVAYRMRNLFLDRWNLWPRLTFYRTWKDEHGQPILDGTNNADERAIGWWVRTVSYHARLQARAVCYQCQSLDCFLRQSFIPRLGFDFDYHLKLKSVRLQGHFWPCFPFLPILEQSPSRC